MEKKVCSKCKEEKELTEFYSSDKSSCKVCLKEKLKERGKEYKKEDYKIKNELLINEGRKICSKCKEEKYLTEFSTSKKVKCGYNAHCKGCDSKRVRVYIKKDTEYTRFINERKILMLEGKCRCYKCKKIKPLTSYLKGRYNRCKDCINEKVIKKRIENDPQYYIKKEEKLKLKKEKEYKKLLLIEGKKKCLNCNHILPVKNFLSILKHYCIKCDEEKKLNHNKKETFIICGKCNVPNKKDNFITYGNKKYGRITICKDCYKNITTKVCNDCGVDKSLDDYYYKGKEKLIREGICKMCNNSKKKIRLKHKLKDQEYLIKFRERKAREKRNKILTNPFYKLKYNICRIIRETLNGKGYTKKSKTYNILGCTFEEFKTHIESQWEEWMNWDNYGKYNGEERYGWDLDHIIPLSSGKCEEDIIRLNHHSNIQPLCSYINRNVKKDKIV
jgi:hypothetical protein